MSILCGCFTITDLHLTYAMFSARFPLGNPVWHPGGRQVDLTQAMQNRAACKTAVEAVNLEFLNSGVVFRSREWFFGVFDLSRICLTYFFKRGNWNWLFFVCLFICLGYLTYLFYQNCCCFCGDQV